MNDFSVQHYTRRLPDKILVAFHAACDQSETEVAAQLLQILEYVIMRPRKPATAPERRSRGSLVAAHERLWPLRHPEALEQWAHSGHMRAEDD